MNLRAAIDIGTNSVLLLVARTDGVRFERVEDHATITRLGQGVDRTRTLDAAAIDRTLTCLRAYAERLKALGVTSLRVAATSAVRDALNREAFVEPATAILGAPVETVSGEREARLTFRGSLLGLPIEAGTAVTTFDIGGGSTEIITGPAFAAPGSARSLDIGVVRLTERHVRHDPPTDSELDAVRADIDRSLATLGPPHPHACLVGIAGTVTTLAAIHHGVVPYASERIHGASLSLDALDALASRLASLTIADRGQVPGLDPRRADVIVAGALLASAVVRWSGDTTVMVSDGGVRVGLLTES